MSELSKAVEDVYVAFSHYRIDEDFFGCDCCVSPERSAKLAATSLRDLTCDDLECYATKAMTTWGDVRHFKHFLPKLLELTITHRDEFLELAVVIGKLSYARWHAWSRREYGAVDGFLRAYWVFQLGQEITTPRDHSIDTVLCAEARAYESVQSLLDTWIATDSIEAVKHVAAFVQWNGDNLLRKQRLINPFWDTGSNAHNEVLAWLSSDAVDLYLNKMELSCGFEAACYQLEAIRAVLK